MFRLLKKNRTQIGEEMKSHEKRRRISPAYFSEDDAKVQAISTYARGKLIDIGCGYMPYKDVILDKVTRYDTMDIEKRDPAVTLVGDVQDMHAIKDGTYDTALCFAVLEHIPRPNRAVAEINRILKKKGILILSVPFLSRLHEQPHDYYRYTRYALRFLLEEGGFEVHDIRPTGGIFSFMGHQASTALLGLSWHIPVVKRIVFHLNYWLCVRTCALLDRSLDLKELLPLAYLCVAEKK